VYDQPISEAARRLDIGLTVLKKYCRKFEISRWPYRKIKSMDKLIESVNEYARDEPLAARARRACANQRNAPPALRASGRRASSRRAAVRLFWLQPAAPCMRDTYNRPSQKPFQTPENPPKKTKHRAPQGVLEELQHFRALIYANPAVDLESRIKRLRQANFKLEYKLRQAERAAGGGGGGRASGGGGGGGGRARARASDGDEEEEEEEECDGAAIVRTGAAAKRGAAAAKGGAAKRGAAGAARPRAARRRSGNKRPRDEEAEEEEEEAVSAGDDDDDEDMSD